MVVNKKVTGKSKSMIVGLGVGLAMSMGVTLLGAALMANLILSGKIGEATIGYGAIVILLLSSITGAWLAAMLIKRQRMGVCLGVGGCYYVTLVAITALFFGGQYQGMGVTALLIFGGCAAVGLLGLRGGKTPGKKVKKYRFR